MSHSGSTIATASRMGMPRSYSAYRYNRAVQWRTTSSSAPPCGSVPVSRTTSLRVLTGWRYMWYPEP